MKRKVTSTESSKGKPAPSLDIDEARKELWRFVEGDEKPPQKRIVITIIPTIYNPNKEFLLHPGITAGEVLDQLGLKDYVLFPLPTTFHYSHLGPPAVAKTAAILRAVYDFKDEEDLYQKLEDGYRLVAIPSSKAKTYISGILNVLFQRETKPISQTTY